MNKIIATGSSSTEDAALDWLKAHGAKVEWCLGVDVIELPETACLEKGGYEWLYAITFSGPDGNKEPQYVEMEHYADAAETILRLKSEE